MNKSISSPYARLVDTQSIIKTLIWVSLIGSLAVSLAFWAYSGIQATSLSLFVLSGFCIILLFLNQAGFNELAGLLLYLVISIVLTYIISTGYAIYDAGMLVFPLLIVLSSLTFGKRAGLLVTGITIVELGLISILGEAGYIQPFSGAVPLIFTDSITTVVILISTYLIVWIVIDLLEKAVQTILESEEKLEIAFDMTLEAWAKGLELREREDPGHSNRVTALAIMLAERMGLSHDEVKHLRQGAFLHDIGKMGIPENILLKTEALTPSEKGLLEKHPQIAVELIDGIEHLDDAKEIILNHHERYDGRGYPRKIRGSDLTLSTQIFAIADCWDMLRTNRPCKEAWPNIKALQYILDQSGKKFIPEVVEAFQQLAADLGFEENE